MGPDTSEETYQDFLQLMRNSYNSDKIKGIGICILLILFYPLHWYNLGMGCMEVIGAIIHGETVCHFKKEFICCHLKKVIYV